MKGNKKKWCACVVIALLSVVWLFCVISINRKYPNPTDKKHVLGETFEFNGFEICATDIQFLDEDIVNNVFKNEVENLGGCKCVLYFLTITNKNPEPERIELGYFIMQTSAWANSVLMHKFGEISQMYYPELPITLRPTLEPGESIQCVLPYTMVKVQFTEKQWASCETAEYELILSLYPVKEYIKMQ